MKVPLLYHEDYKDYFFGPLHPFEPARFAKFVEIVESTDVLRNRFIIEEAHRATDEELSSVHTQDYISRVTELGMHGGRLSPDTPVRPGALEAARLIVGGTIKGLERAEETGYALNFGGLHHSGRDYGEGFCLFNDIAVGTALDVEKGKKVCIFDTDAHQGNGTMDIFYTSPEVLFISIHQDPRTLYPGRGYVHEIGKKEGQGFTVNIPLPPDADIADYIYAVDKVVIGVVEQFDPDVVIRNGGSDPHHSDTLTDLGLDMRGLEYLGKTGRELAERTGAKYLDLMLSGYGRRVVDGWIAIAKGAFDIDIPLPEDRILGRPGSPSKESLRKTVQEIKDVLRSYWSF